MNFLIVLIWNYVDVYAIAYWNKCISIARLITNWMKSKSKFNMRCGISRASM